PALRALGQRLRPDLELLVRIAVARAAPLHDGVAVTDRRHLAPDLRERLVLRRLERDLRAALEVDPEVQAPDAERGGPDHDDHARDREPEVAPAHEVDLQPAALLLA